MARTRFVPPPLTVIVIGAAASLAGLAAGLAGVSAIGSSGRAAALLAAIAGAVVVAAAAAGRPSRLAPGLALSAGAPLAAAASGRLDGTRSVVAATALVLAGELTAWAWARHRVVTEPAGRRLARIGLLAVTAAGATTVAAMVRDAGRIHGPHGAWAVLAAAAAIVAVGVLSSVRRWDRPPGQGRWARYATRSRP